MLSIRGLEKTFVLDPEGGRREPRRLEVLRGIDLDIAAGEMVALTGPSGSGKSTFLNLVGALDTPSGGEVRFEGQDLFGLDEAARAAFRNAAVGFIFQSHHLLPEFTAEENAMMPALIRRVARGEARRAAREMLGLVGLADEPTGNLDPATAEGIHQLLADLNARLGITAIVVTHNERLAAALPRRLRLQGGRLVHAAA